MMVFISQGPNTMTLGCLDTLQPITNLSLKPVILILDSKLSHKGPLISEDKIVWVTFMIVTNRVQGKEVFRHYTLHSWVTKTPTVGIRKLSIQLVLI